MNVCSYGKMLILEIADHLRSANDIARTPFRIIHHRAGQWARSVIINHNLDVCGDWLPTVVTSLHAAYGAGFSVTS
jgi:hypothetical protein